MFIHSLPFSCWPAYRYTHMLTHAHKHTLFPRLPELDQWKSQYQTPGSLKATGGFLGSAQRCLSSSHFCSTASLPQIIPGMLGWWGRCRPLLDSSVSPGFPTATSLLSSSGEGGSAGTFRLEVFHRHHHVHNTNVYTCAYTFLHVAVHVCTLTVMCT